MKRWLRESWILYLRYMRASLFVIPVGVLYGVFVLYYGENKWALVVALCIGLPLMHIGFNWGEKK